MAQFRGGDPPRRTTICPCAFLVTAPREERRIRVNVARSKDEGAKRARKKDRQREREGGEEEEKKRKRKKETKKLAGQFADVP